MSSVQESLLLKALRREPVSRTPVWIMRQAGRYLPEYRQTRALAGDFLSLCKNPELACEVTLQPLKRYHLDAAIVFSDILIIPDALGLGLQFKEGEGPFFTQPIRGLPEIKNLYSNQDDFIEKLSYLPRAVQLIRHSLPETIPLIGFAGSPWTLACYMLEGKSSRDFKQISRLIYEEAEMAHLLLQKLTTAVINVLEMQVEAGANVMMIFDTWGGILTTSNYHQYSLAYMDQIVTALKNKWPHLPIILFTKGGRGWLEAMAKTGCDCLGLDWTIDLAWAKSQLGKKVALQGNLDPNVLLMHPRCIKKEVKAVVEAYGKDSGHIFNLGHGITPDVPPEHVGIMVDAIQEYSSI